MALTRKHMDKVCRRFDGSNQCRYLGIDDDTLAGVCYKLVQDKKAAIDRQCFKFHQDSVKIGVDPYKSGRPLGNNCKGYYPLKTLPQGFDVTN